MANRMLNRLRLAGAALLGRKAWEDRVLERMLNPATANRYDEPADQLKAVTATSWVYACCRIIGEAFSKVSYWFEDASGNEVEIPELAQLLERPNPYQSGRELREGTMWHLLLTGKAYWFLGDMTALSGFRLKANGEFEVDELGAPILKVPGNLAAGAVPKQIWLLQPDCVTPKVGTEGVLFEKFIYEPSPGNCFEFPPEAIIYHRFFDPRSMTKGLGVIEAAATAVEQDREAGQYNTRFFKNSAVPGGVLTSDQNLSQEDADRIEARWRQNFLGADKAHRVAVLGQGAKYAPASVAQKDMEFVASRNFSMAEIIAMFGVPPSKVSQMKDTNRASAAEEDKTFWAECIEPKLSRFADKINADLLPRWSANAKMVFEDVTPDDLQQQAETAIKLVGAAIWTINEARDRFDWGEHVKWGDEPWLPPGVSQPSNPLPTFNPAPKPPVSEEPPPAEPASEAEPAESIPPKMPFALGKALPEAQHEELRQGFADAARRFFKAQAEAVATALDGNPELAALSKSVSLTSRKATSDDFATTFLPWGEWVDRFDDEMTPAVEAAVKAGGMAALADLGVELAFDLTDPRVVAWMRGHLPELAGGVNDTTRQAIANALADGIAAGETTPALAERVAAVFEQADSFRADLIARTEEMQAQMRGHLEGWQQSGIVGGKEWDALDDACEECADMDGDFAALDEEFKNGQMIPDVHPNERCTVLPILSDEWEAMQKAAPAGRFKMRRVGGAIKYILEET